MSEVRLIDANALKYKNLAEVNGRLTYVLTAEEIDNAPTIAINCKDCDGYEAGYSAGLNDAERSKGEWKLSVISKSGIDWYKCSVCGREIHTTEEMLKDYPFCHCGADMRKGGTEE